MYTIKCDTHTHTLYSRHAFSTIEENVRAAAEQGMELLATTDHFSDMLYPEVHIRHYQYLFNQDMLPRTWHGSRCSKAARPISSTWKATFSATGSRWRKISWAWPIKRSRDWTGS